MSKINGIDQRAERDQRIITEFFTGKYNIEELAAHTGISPDTVGRAISKHFKQLADKRERDRSGEN